MSRFYGSVCRLQNNILDR